ncbi:MAG TPA: S9 family peptidase [Pyrinomonadaceae bacterium]|nr:S9 family peptidase [Pyrinomonadaceae bacterium]
MKTRSLPGLAFCLTFFACAVHAQPTRRPMAPADILRIANVGDPQISPDGERVVYTVTTVDGNLNVTTLWTVRIDNSSDTPTSRQPEQRRDRYTQTFPASPLLPSGWQATNPRWSPDGKRIAFLATADNHYGVWVVSIDGSRPRFVAAVSETNFFITYAGEPLAWSPDSKSIAYISASVELSFDPHYGDRQADPLVVDRIQYKSRTSYSDNLRTHVWITDIDEAAPRQLTTGLAYDHALSFSPRGDEIAFVSNHELDPDAINNSDIFAVDLRGQVRQITNTKGCEYEPTWSPDGKWIAFTATKRDLTTIDSVAEDAHVWVISAGGDDRRELTASQDRRARNPRWRPDSRALYFSAGDRGQTLIYEADVEHGRVRPVFGAVDQRRTGELNSEFRGSLDSTSPSTVAQRIQVTAFSISTQQNGGEMVAGANRIPIQLTTMATVISAPLHPAELWIGRGDVLTRATSHNDSFRRSGLLTEPEEYRFRSFDGNEIQGWLMRPVGWRADRKYPMILSIHGGPHGMYGYAFNPTFQAYAMDGYAVLYLNPRGSNGYGQKFSDGTLNEWGGGDYRDLMAGVDEALKRYQWIDPNRLGVTGGSYGGFMTNWIITQTPRFKAAVSVASVSNLISFYSTSLYQDLIHVEFGGFPWDNYDLLWQWSPLRYARQAQTPTMFIHGESDNDVHITQAEEMYMALKRRGVETVLVRYPREGHGLREPRHRVDALERTLAWFDRFLK